MTTTPVIQLNEGWRNMVYEGAKKCYYSEQYFVSVFHFQIGYIRTSALRQALSSVMELHLCNFLLYFIIGCQWKPKLFDLLIRVFVTFLRLLEIFVVESVSRSYFNCYRATSQAHTPSSLWIWSWNFHCRIYAAVGRLVWVSLQFNEHSN